MMHSTSQHPVITMAQWKGGVGKSTLAVHLAARLGAVLIDLDPSGGATRWWGGAHAFQLWQHPRGAAVLRAIATGRTPRPRRGEGGRPPLVASHEELLVQEHGGPETVWAFPDGRPSVMVATPHGQRPFSTALAEGIRSWASSWQVPVVIDTAPEYGSLADGAIAAADVVVAPVTLDQWAVSQLRVFMTSYARRVRRGVVVLNRVEERKRIDRQWGSALIQGDLVTEPFVLGPVVDESEAIRGATRPLRGPFSPERQRAVDQLDRVAEFLLAEAGRPQSATITRSATA